MAVRMVPVYISVWTCGAAFLYSVKSCTIAIGPYEIDYGFVRLSLHQIPRGKRPCVCSELPCFHRAFLS